MFGKKDKKDDKKKHKDKGGSNFPVRDPTVPEEEFLGSVEQLLRVGAVLTPIDECGDHGDPKRIHSLHELPIGVKYKTESGKCLERSDASTASLMSLRSFEAVDIVMPLVDDVMFEDPDLLREGTFIRPISGGDDSWFKIYSVAQMATGTKYQTIQTNVVERYTDDSAHLLTAKSGFTKALSLRFPPPDDVFFSTPSLFGRGAFLKELNRTDDEGALVYSLHSLAEAVMYVTEAGNVLVRMSQNEAQVLTKKSGFTQGTTFKLPPEDEVRVLDAEMVAAGMYLRNFQKLGGQLVQDFLGLAVGQKFLTSQGNVLERLDAARVQLLTARSGFTKAVIVDLSTQVSHCPNEAPKGALLPDSPAPSVVAPPPVPSTLPPSKPDPEDTAAQSQRRLSQIAVPPTTVAPPEEPLPELPAPTSTVPSMPKPPSAAIPPPPTFVPPPPSFTPPTPVGIPIPPPPTFVPPAPSFAPPPAAAVAVPPPPSFTPPVAPAKMAKVPPPASAPPPSAAVLKVPPPSGPPPPSAIVGGPAPLQNVSPLSTKEAAPAAAPPVDDPVLPPDAPPPPPGSPPSSPPAQPKFPATQEELPVEAAPFADSVPLTQPALPTEVATSRAQHAMSVGVDEDITPPSAPPPPRDSIVMPLVPPPPEDIPPPPTVPPPHARVMPPSVPHPSEAPLTPHRAAPPPSVSKLPSTPPSADARPPTLRSSPSGVGPPKGPPPRRGPPPGGPPKGGPPPGGPPPAARPSSMRGPPPIGGPPPASTPPSIRKGPPPLANRKPSLETGATTASLPEPQAAPTTEATLKDQPDLQQPEPEPERQPEPQPEPDPQPEPEPEPLVFELLGSVPNQQLNHTTKSRPTQKGRKRPPTQKIKQAVSTDDALFQPTLETNGVRTVAIHGVAPRGPAEATPLPSERASEDHSDHPDATTESPKKKYVPSGARGMGLPGMVALGSVRLKKVVLRDTEGDEPDTHENTDPT